MADKDGLSVGEAYFVQFHKPEFGTYSLDDEELHPEDKVSKPHYALTETQYYGFFVPEKNIHCFTWIWFHPNLNTLTAGTMAWKGVKKHNLGCELIDYRNHMSGDVFRGGFTSYKLDSGLEVEWTKPGREVRLRYGDAARSNHFDIVQTAVAEPVSWPTSKHFEQVMHCTGELSLRGEKHKVDCFSVRDRSFGEYRVEQPMGIPPNSWITGVFDAGLSFCVVGMDDPGLGPIWADKFSVPRDSCLRFGWIMVDGKKKIVREARTKTDYDMDNLLPTKIRMILTDEDGTVYEIAGEVGASTPFTAWLNSRVVICLVHWKYGRKTGVGEIQSAQFTDFVHAYSNDVGGPS
jgi:hypothetical protein